MSTSATDFINLTAFAKAVAQELKGSVGETVAPKRVFTLDEAAAYCGLTRDSFKKKGHPRSDTKGSPRQTSAFRQADLDAWIDSCKEEITGEAA